MNYRRLLRSAFTLAAVAAFANATPGAAQQRGTIRGTIREADTQRPVPGVQVFIPGTQMATVTDAQGRFEFPGVQTGGAQVRVRAVGYSAAFATTTVVGGQTVTVDFALNKSVVALDEVVVTGTGATAERRQLGNTIATVRADALEVAPVRDVSTALAAREAGVSILPTSGLAGEGARIRIRGNASLAMSNEPVVYVDGVRIDNGSIGRQPTGRLSPLDNINPETIDRIEILKGAAAATLYGSEASAGVIQIFTKRGTQGRTKFSFRVDQGGSRFPDDRVEDNWGFARTQAQADRLNAIHRNTHIDNNGQPGIQLFEAVGFPNLSAKAAWATGYDATYSATATGGGADATYNVAARYSYENGPYDVSNIVGPGQTFNDILPYEPGKEDFVRKYQGSGNIQLFPKDRITLGIGFLYTDVTQQTPENANNIYGVQSSMLNARPENGQCTQSINRQLGGTFGEDPNRPGFCAGPGNPWGNLAFSTPRENTYSRPTVDLNHFNANAKATYTPMQSRLSFDVTVGVDVVNSRGATFIPFGNNVDFFSARVPLGIKDFDARFNQEISLDTKARWTESFGMFSSQFTAGGQGFISKSHFRTGTGRDFPGPGLEVTGAGATRSSSESFSNVVNLGLMGEEQVGINEWAFVTLGGRWDRNSAFGEATSGAFYPKVNTSLVISDMPSWTSTTLSTLRVRAALGRSGLQPGAFDRFLTYGAGTARLSGADVAGLVPANLGNDSLKPEVTTEWEAGAEVGLFNNRLGLEAVRWSRNTADALVDRQYPVTGGFISRQLSNIGELEAKGWEFKFNALALDRPGLSVNLFANAAYLFQRIVSLGGAPPIKVGGTYDRYRNFLTEGQAPGVLFGAVIMQPCGTTNARFCLQPDQFPFDVNNDGVPDTRAQLEAYFAGNATGQCNRASPGAGRSGCNLDLFNSPTFTGIAGQSGRGPFLDDRDRDGDFLSDECMADRTSSKTTGNFKLMKRMVTDPVTGVETEVEYEYCLTKSYPDWSGSFGADISVARNFRINLLFEYRFGNYFVSNLTDGFRNSNPLIGRNNKRPAELEAIIENAATSAQEKVDALLEFMDVYKELSPYPGLNLAEKADFLRFREASITYTAPASFAQSLGLSNVSFNLSARNPFLWTGYSGIDPEMNATAGRGSDLSSKFLDSVDAWSLPLPRRVAFSVRFGL
jgi:TonB-linked SusC/RagA family outer membrane protein